MRLKLVYFQKNYFMDLSYCSLKRVKTPFLFGQFSLLFPHYLQHAVWKDWEKTLLSPTVVD